MTSPIEKPLEWQRLGVRVIKTGRHERLLEIIKEELVTHNSPYKRDDSARQ